MMGGGALADSVVSSVSRLRVCLSAAADDTPTLVLALCVRVRTSDATAGRFQLRTTGERTHLPVRQCIYIYLLSRIAFE